jgi:hypothetical protein
MISKNKQEVKNIWQKAKARVKVGRHRQAKAVKAVTVEVVSDGL